VVGLVRFNEGLAVGESVNELLAMGIGRLQQGDSHEELVNEVLAVGESVAFDGQTTVLAAIWGGGGSMSTQVHTVHTHQ
jgi:hypothetical protein